MFWGIFSRRFISRIAKSGRKSCVTTANLLPTLISVNIALELVSLPVPAVVGTATNLAFFLSWGSEKGILSFSKSKFGFSYNAQATLVPSIIDPPPIATIQSGENSLISLTVSIIPFSWGSPFHFGLKILVSNF